MNDASRIAAAQTALAGNPPLPTDGQVIREAMSRILPMASSEIAQRWRRCPETRCRRERCCMAPQMECVAAPRFPIANIETTHEWLAKKLREELLNILLERALGREEGTSEPAEKPTPSPRSPSFTSPRLRGESLPSGLTRGSPARARAKAGG